MWFGSYGSAFAYTTHTHRDIYVVGPDKKKEKELLSELFNLNYCVTTAHTRCQQS